jgi:hypothetical protein
MDRRKLTGDAKTTGIDWASLTAEQRRARMEPAHNAIRRRGNDRRIREIVERAGQLTPAQVETLRALLPDPGDDHRSASS